jgi:hypothetical protein
MSAMKVAMKPQKDFILPSEAIEAMKVDISLYKKIIKDLNNDDLRVNAHEEFLGAPRNVMWSEKISKSGMAYCTTVIRHNGVIHSATTPPCEIVLFGVKSPEKRIFSMGGKETVMDPNLSFKCDTVVNCHINGEEYPDEPIGEMFLTWNELFVLIIKYMSKVKEVIDGDDEDDIISKSFPPCPNGKDENGKKTIKDSDKRYVSLKFSNIPPWLKKPFHVKVLNEYIGGVIKTRKNGHMFINQKDKKLLSQGWEFVAMDKDNVHEYICGGQSIIVISWGEFKCAPTGWSTTIKTTTLEMQCADVVINESDKQASSVGDKLFGSTPAPKKDYPEDEFNYGEDDLMKDSKVRHEVEEFLTKHDGDQSSNPLLEEEEEEEEE